MSGPVGVVSVQRKGCHFAVLPFYIHRKAPNMLKEALVESELRKLSTLSLLAAYCLL